MNANTIPVQPTVPPMPKPNTSKNGRLGTTFFELDDDYIYRVTPIDDKGNCMSYIVMDKKTFVEAFKRWVEKRA